MTKRLTKRRLLVGLGAAALVVAAVSTAVSQFGSEGWHPRGGGGYGRGRRGGRTDLSDYPGPDRDIFPGDNFTFARVAYHFTRRGWMIDYPDSDINFPTRLSEMTTIEIAKNPDGSPKHIVIDIMDDKLFNYPILFMVEVGGIEFTDEEVPRLREYLLRGGFIHVDDFWGVSEWETFKKQIERVLPPDEYPIVDIPLDHPLFHIVFDVKEVPQIPCIEFWMATHQTSEKGEESKTAECKGIFDKRGRLMMVMTHNTDLGDGWEREGEDPEYFTRFSVGGAYPLGINIVVYAMTH